MSEILKVDSEIAKMLLIVLMLIQLVVDNNVLCQQDGGKLLMAHTLCRHGDRNIAEPYPNDPWSSEDYWPGGFSQLTELGKQQLFDLGQYFRERYAALFQDNKSAANEIYIESTNSTRVIQSAQACAVGFFSSNEVDSKSIPIHVIPSEDDYTLSVERPCDRFEYLQIEYEHTPAYTKLFEDNQEFLNYLEEKSGMKFTSLSAILGLYDPLFVEILKNYSLPSWAEEVMKSNNQLKNLALQLYEIYTPTNDMKKLQSGFLLEEILSHFSDAVGSVSPSDRKLWIYVTHDLALANMLNSLGVFERHDPPYSACVLLELYENKSSPFVQVFYRNTTTTDVPPLEIPNCGTKCPLDNFYELYDDILPKNSFDEECTLHAGEQLPSEGNPEPPYL